MIRSGLGAQLRSRCAAGGRVSHLLLVPLDELRQFEEPGSILQPTTGSNLRASQEGATFPKSTSSAHLVKKREGLLDLILAEVRLELIPARRTCASGARRQAEHQGRPRRALHITRQRRVAAYGPSRELRQLEQVEPAIVVEVIARKQPGDPPSLIRAQSLSCIIKPCASTGLIV